MDFPDDDKDFLRDVAVDADGNVYAANNTHIQKFSPDGTLLLEWGGDGAQGVPDDLAFITGLAVRETADQTLLYVADGAYNSIRVFNADGAFVESSGRLLANPADPDSGMNLQGIAFNSQGLLAVVDDRNHRIHLINNKWQIVKSWGSEGNGPGQFREPWGIAVDSYNNIYVSDFTLGRITKFDYQGENPVIWASELDRPKHIAIDAADQLYVTESSIAGPSGSWQGTARPCTSGAVNGITSRAISIRRQASPLIRSFILSWPTCLTGGIQKFARVLMNLRRTLC